jgi:hypothetical protein
MLFLSLGQMRMCALDQMRISAAIILDIEGFVHHIVY